MKQTVISRMFPAMICMLMLISAPLPAMAQRRGADRTERTDNRGGKRADHNNHNSKHKDKKADHSRPTANHGNHKDSHNNNNHNARPDGNRNPGNNNPGGYRPGAPGANRPSGNHHQGHTNPGSPGNHIRPGNPVPPGGPVHTWTPGAANKVRPGHAIHRPQVAPPPSRPMRPAHFFGYARPVPPPSWRPGPRPLFSTVLGLAFGTAINTAIDALITNGYTVDGYTNNIVYVNDAVQLNMRWPYGALLYNNGVLSGSEFSYSSDWRDLNRYNMAYARLSSLYGAPVSSYNRGGELSATWWGPGGQYVTLRFDYRAPMSGRNRYYTTLSFGI